MGKYNRYIKRFSTEAEFIAFKNSDDYIEPNLSFITESNGFHFDEPKDSFEPRYLTFEMVDYLGDPYEAKSSDELESGIIIACIGAPPPDSIEPGGGTVAKSGAKSSNDEFEFANIEYSTDGGNTWTKCEFELNNIPQAPMQQYSFMIETEPNDIVMFRGINDTLSYSDDNYEIDYNFYLGGYFNCSGDVTSLLNGRGGDVDLSDKPYCFTSLFYEQSGLLTGPSLSSTKLGKYCYEDMFSGCESLTTAPELPATTLAEGCYNNMFNGCTSLITAPDLPAITLAQDCYSGMFSGCSSLETVKAWFTNADASHCLSSWLDNVGSGYIIYIKYSTYENYVLSQDKGALGIPSTWSIYDIDTNEILEGPDEVIK